MRIGIVGHAADKFHEASMRKAKSAIADIIGSFDRHVIISGGCHLGGVDLWAIERAKQMGCRTVEHLPEVRQWNPAGKVGYMKRNLAIANDVQEIHVIVVAKLPSEYKGMRHPLCYHCGTDDHVKSGACWTAIQAQRLGKEARWHII